MRSHARRESGDLFELFPLEAASRYSNRRNFPPTNDPDPAHKGTRFPRGTVFLRYFAKVAQRPRSSPPARIAHLICRRTTANHRMQHAKHVASIRVYRPAHAARSPAPQDDNGGGFRLTRSACNGDFTDELNYRSLVYSWPEIAKSRVVLN